MTQSMDALTLPDVLTDNTLTTFYFEERSTLALKNGTIITCDISALRLKDIREHIRTVRELHDGLYFGQNLPIKQVDASVIDEYFERSALAEQSHHHREKIETEVSLRLKRLQQKAVNLGSSDIHIELYEHETQFYARVDGRRVPLEHTIPLHEVGEKLFGYIFTAKAETTDNDFVTMTPNNGQIEQLLDCPIHQGTQREEGEVKTEQRLTQWRVSYIPAKGGGKVTLRWLNASKTIPPLDAMGLHPGHVTLLKNFCFGNSGLCMIAGKTGSGKSTLIAALLKLFGKDKAVHTLEDPPEFDLGIPQTHATPNQRVNDEEFVRGFNYYSKVLLRHDVDVELHGEVRDNKGAMEVTRKGETGQIMFTTLHTSSAMGIGHTLTEQLHVPAAVVAAPDLMRIWAYQTLVRTLCPHCKMNADTAKAYYTEREKGDTFTALLQQSQQLCGEQVNDVYYKRIDGCKHCVEGEKGRTALFEIIVLDDEDRAFILNKDYLGWQTALKAKGFKNVRDHAISKIKTGLIDIETASQKVAHLIPTESQQQYGLLDFGFDTEACNQTASHTPHGLEEEICNLNAP